MSRLKNPKIAWCKAKHKFLTKKQVRLHSCLDLPRTRSPCTSLVKLDVSYWKDRKAKRDKGNSYQKQRKAWLRNDTERKPNENCSS